MSPSTLSENHLFGLRNDSPSKNTEGVFLNNVGDEFRLYFRRHFEGAFIRTIGVSLFARQTNRKLSNHHDPLDHHAIKPLMKNAIIVLPILLPP